MLSTKIVDILIETINVFHKEIFSHHRFDILKEMLLERTLEVKALGQEIFSLGKRSASREEELRFSIDVVVELLEIIIAQPQHEQFLENTLYLNRLHTHRKFATSTLHKLSNILLKLQNLWFKYIQWILKITLSSYYSTYFNRALILVFNLYFYNNSQIFFRNMSKCRCSLIIQPLPYRKYECTSHEYKNSC